jgi:hypothetical protein
MRTTVAPSALATQITPLPLAMLAGSSPIGIRSRSEPLAGSIRQTPPLLASATQTVLAPVVIADGVPGLRLSQRHTSGF